MKNLKIEEGKVIYNVDTNEDGESSLKAKLHLSEAMEEAIAREEAVEGVKVADFKFNLTKLVIKLDSDKDGEEVLDLEIDLAEVYDEIMNKKKEK